MDKLNFRELLNKYNSIVIPKIQRDYAQGRNDSKSQSVRKHLLKDIFSKNKTIDFDFIFGTNQNNYFIPLDGQQRLTTLFLLYLYGIKTNKIKPLALNRFTYDTRHAAKDFCQAIVNNDWNISDKPSIIIQNSIWFMDYWKYDPTVDSMLRMLNAIHEEALKGFFPNLDNIDFYFFDMNEHGLSEDLYLKMNSRGKPLTAFENLKADIDTILPSDINVEAFSCLEKEDEDNGETFSDKWKYYIDRDWTNFFWVYKDEHNLIDSAFIVFMANVLACYWAVNVKVIDNKDATNELITKKHGVFWELTNLTGKEEFIDFNNFKSVFDLNKGDAFYFLARTLSLFSVPSYKSQIIEKTYYPYTKEEDEDSLSLIERICKGKVTNKSRALLYAIILYPNTDYESHNFEHWIRVIWNLLENANLNGVSELHLIKDLSKQLTQNDIYEILNTYVIKEKGFASEQLNEEKEKAEQILKNRNFEETIVKAEKYAFFKGAIRFLYRDENGSCDWNNFDIKWKNAQDYFDENGVKDSNQNYKTEALLLKAFISQLLSPQQNKYIFDNSKETWKDNILLKTEYCKAVNNIMSGQIKTFENSDHIINKICNSNLLLYLSTKQVGSRINWIHNHRSIYQYGAGNGIFIDYEMRDKLLFELQNKNEEPKIKISNSALKFGTIFLYGWFVQFDYRGNKFNWHPNNEVFLQKNNKDTKESFIVSEQTSSSDFVKSCDELIEKYISQES